MCFSFFIYSETNKKIVPTNDIHNIEINATTLLESNTTITGEVELAPLESVALSTPTLVNDILYITTMKKLSIFPKNTLKVDLNQLDNLANVDKIILIGGNFYSNTGKYMGISMNEFKNINDQKIIWEKLTR